MKRNKWPKFTHDWNPESISYNRAMEILYKHSEEHVKLLKGRPLNTEALIKAPQMVIVASEQWQKLRHSLVGKWKNEPNQIFKNVQKLKDYVQDAGIIQLRQVHYFVNCSFFKKNVTTVAFIEFRSDINNKWQELIKHT